MFSLIITIISIALVAVLALATLYYGGDAFNRGSAGAEAARLINEGQQVNAAVTMADVDKVTHATLADLVPAYLSQAPGKFATTTPTNSGSVSVTGLTQEVCQEVQKKAVGSTAEVADVLAAGQLYGCNTDAVAGTYTFVYGL